MFDKKKTRGEGTKANKRKTVVRDMKTKERGGKNTIKFYGRPAKYATKKALSQFWLK